LVVANETRSRVLPSPLAGLICGTGKVPPYQNQLRRISALIRIWGWNPAAHRNPVVPIQSVWKFGCCELKVNHPTRLRKCTRRRRVKKQWAHDQCSPFWNGAGYKSFLVPFSNLFCGKPPFAMRTGDYAQRPVVNSAFVQMQPDGEKAAHYLRWRLYMQNSGLHRPRTKSTNVRTLTDGDCQILVPHYFPI